MMSSISVTIVMFVGASAFVFYEAVKLPSRQELSIGPMPKDADDDKFFSEWLQEILNITTPAPTAVDQSKCPACPCGITNQQRRIVGGVETKVNEYPWVALLLYKGRFYCGGSVINSKYVMTAGHCVDRFDKSLIKVRILEHNRIVENETKTEEFKIKEVKKHKEYSSTNFNNDIALLKIDGEFKFDNRMRPVCLPERTKTFTGEVGIVTGWGATNEGGPVSTTLREVSVPIMSNAECRKSKYPARKITDNMLCAGLTKGQKDSCQGDSGGPLHVVNNSRHRVVGIVSWGEGCAKPGFPGVYTRVNRFLTWIEHNTVDACYCSPELSLKNN